MNVASPPKKPLLIYDGECNFCRCWIERWRLTTGDAVEYIAFQDPSIATRFPEIPTERFEQAVQLIERDGLVSGGAEAALRTLAHAPGNRWQLWCYRRLPGVAISADWSYKLVARNRRFFSALTRLLFGQSVEPPTYTLTRDLFFRMLGLVYLCAFVSLWPQILGLIGSNGILPAAPLLEANESHNGFIAYWVMPTLCWLNCSDWFLKFLCGAGAVLSLLPMAGLASTPVIFLLWLLYLSLANIGQDFLSFQWDALLLETGLLAIFFAPCRFLPQFNRDAPVSRTGLWLLRYLLFRLMFESGVVKLTWNDPTWRDLTVLTFHYETQPLPTWISWHAHQLPLWFQKLSCVVMYVVELGLPWLIFAPRRLRFVTCGGITMLMILIGLTGNYTFFNLLAVALCVLLLDDAALQDLVGAIFNRDRLASLIARSRIQFAPTKPGRRWPWWIIAPLTVVLVFVTTMQVYFSFRPRVRPPRFVTKAFTFTYSTLAPLNSANSYGLFRVMTRPRYEIIIEGSNDGLTWLPYEFKYKPGEVKRRPGFCEPHQPRLDWQMWFEALRPERAGVSQWFANLCIRLFQGKRDVLALIDSNPFPDSPPQYLRAMVYEYHFTDIALRRADGAWWTRRFVRPYIPVVSRSALEKQLGSER